MLKLPYNRGQNVFDAAQDFINENAKFGITQDSKEAIVQHILKLIDPSDQAALGPSRSPAAGSTQGPHASGGDVAFSEFAKEAAEMRARGERQAQSWTEARQRIEQSSGAGGAADVAFSTYAQEGREMQQRQQMLRGHPPHSQGGMSTNASSPSSSSSSTTTCFTSFETFCAYNTAAATKKLKELLPDEGQMMEVSNVIQRCVALTTETTMCDTTAVEDVLTLIIALHSDLASSPTKCTFPAVDLMRLVAGFSRHACELIAASSDNDGWGAWLPSVLEFCSTNAAVDADRIVTCRLMCNVISQTLTSEILESRSGDAISQTTAILSKAMVARTTALLRATMRSSATGSATRTASLSLVRNLFVAIRHALLALSKTPMGACRDDEETAGARVQWETTVITPLVAVAVESLLHLKDSEARDQMTLLAAIGAPLVFQQASPCSSRYAMLVEKLLGPSLRMMMAPGGCADASLLRCAQEIRSLLCSTAGPSGSN